MKKTLLFFMLFALLSGSTALFAQPGVNCSSPSVVSSLPFLQTGMTTAGFLNDYNDTMACGSAYMTGEDFVFSYTPATNQIVNIQLSNTGQYVGLFLIDSCPDVAGASCVGQSGSLLGNNTLTNLSLTAGHTYYILVDTQTPILGFIPNPNTAFDIEITEVNPYDVACNFIESPAASACEFSLTPLSINVSNLGLVDVDSFNVSYSINGAPAVTDTFYNLLAVGASASFTFSVVPDFSTDNTMYTIQAWTSLDNDGVPANDITSVDITNLLSVNTFPYAESFETGNGGWISGGTNSSWALGLPTAMLINSASDGTAAWVTNLSGNYNAGESSYLDSPCFDFSTLTVPVLKFDLWYENSGVLDYATIQYSTDQGVSWTTIGQLNDYTNWYNTVDGWSGNTGGWMTASHKLDGLGGLTGVQLRIAFTGSLIQTAEGFAFDHVEIAEALTEDAGIVAITSPITSCGLGYEAVTVLVHNFGSDSLSNIPLMYSVDGGSAITENLAITLAPDSSASYTFTTTTDYSLAGLYNIVAATVWPGDMDASNDSSSMAFANQISIAAFPYAEGFESGDGGWIAGGTNSSFDLGHPAAAIIDHAASDSNAWVTNLTGNTNMLENSWVMSPCLDFTTLTLPVFEMQLWYETSALLDNVVVETSVDSGANWVIVGNTGAGMNWYSAQDGWAGQSGDYITVKHSLDGLGGAGNVKIRVSFNGGNIPAEGLAFDDVRIYETPEKDLAVTSIVSPETSCGLSLETVAIWVNNFGIDTMTDFPVKYSIDGGATWETDTISASILPNDSLYYQFAVQASLATQGSYDIWATTALVGDQDLTNDTTKIVVYNYSNNVFPYLENFESNNGFFSTLGTSSWEWGVPSAAVISSAASDSNAWVTNLSGDYLANENSSLYSTCLDFSTLNNPYIEFNIWYETSLMGSVILEGSVDGGSSWFTIGSSSDNNWYDGLLVTGFSGSSAGWVLKTHALDGMAGESNCLVRVTLDAGNSFLGLNEGVGIDDIRIWECTLPTASFTGELDGSSFSGTNTSTNGTSCLWDFGDGNSSATTNVLHTYTATGAYTVTLTVYNECGEASSTQNVNVLGISDAGHTLAFECYPNPNQGQFVMNVLQNDLQDLNVEILDITGRVIYSEKIAATREYRGTIDLGSGAQGLYSIRVSSATQIYNGKVVVE